MVRSCSIYLLLFLLLFNNPSDGSEVRGTIWSSTHSWGLRLLQEMKKFMGLQNKGPAHPLSMSIGARVETPFDFEEELVGPQEGREEFGL
uniref:Uncharacterized protein n=1 Tax=Lepeophtheirus salmonis TaxID=72036 RepID=A0A0K2TNY3_LEPSM